MKELPPYVNNELVELLERQLKDAKSGALVSLQWIEWRKDGYLEFDFVGSPDHDMDDLIPELEQQLFELRLLQTLRDPDSVLNTLLEE